MYGQAKHDMFITYGLSTMKRKEEMQGGREKLEELQNQDKPSTTRRTSQITQQCRKKLKNAYFSKFISDLKNNPKILCSTIEKIFGRTTNTLQKIPQTLCLMRLQATSEGRLTPSDVIF